MSAQSDADTRTLSDTDAARLSISTSSTLPPSYRTRRSAGSVYIPIPMPDLNYPPFPPPVYTPQPWADPPAPPSAFRMPRQPEAPRRRQRRRLPAAAPPKALDGQSAGPTYTSGGHESQGDGTRDGDRGSGREGTEAVSTFSAGRVDGSALVLADDATGEDSALHSTVDGADWATLNGRAVDSRGG